MSGGVKRGLNLRRRGGKALVSDFFSGLLHTLAWLGKRSPSARRRLKATRCQRGLTYGPHGEKNTLDIYRAEPQQGGAQATVLYLHGGGFRILSKESHWSFALQLVELGYTVVLPNYRLSGDAACPAALEDAAAALEWCLDNAEQEAIDPSRLLIAGESAGGNLCMMLTQLCIERGPTPWAQRLFDRRWIPAAQVPLCPFAQLRDAERYRGLIPDFYIKRIRFLAESYLAESATPELGEPLLRLENELPFARQIPPTFLSVGGRDPILNDSERCAAALEARGSPHRYHFAPNGHHAFQASLWGPSARDFWACLADFLREHQLPPAP